MPHFFFHVRNGDNYTPDLEGDEYPDLNAAKTEALKSGQEIISEVLLNGSSPDTCQFEITNENGIDVAVVRFTEVLN